jgi:hypothetical protein
MKKLTTLILIFFTINVYAQTTVIPKNADKIIVLNDKTAEENFIKVKQTLADKDIAIAVQDRDVFQISTGKIRLNNNSSCSYLINCRDNKISITGTWGTTMGLQIGYVTSNPSTYAIKYKGNQKVIFNQMDELAKELGTEIKYEVPVVKKMPKNDDVY